MAAAVHFERVGMRYHLDAEVLSDISFTLESGSFHFLTGPSGAGKSSLLRLLTLAERPSRGRMLIFGRDMATIGRRARPALRRRIGIVFQDFRLLDHLTTAENVALPLQLAGGLDPQTIRAHVTELLRWVGLGHRLDAYPPTLSGGEKQRAAIARAVVKKPELLIADEPSGNVDPEISRRLMHLFLELNRLGTTTLVATHDTELVEAVGGRVLHLERGRLIDIEDRGPLRNPVTGARITEADHRAPPHGMANAGAQTRPTEGERR